jgi:hypothetical protein
LSAPPFISVVVPRGTELDNLVVEVYADPAAHANDHAFAVHRLAALLEVLDDVCRDARQPLARADHRFKLRPLRLEPLLDLGFWSTVISSNAGSCWTRMSSFSRSGASRAS